MLENTAAKISPTFARLTSLPSPGLSPQRGLVWAFYVGDGYDVQLMVYENNVINGAKDRGISLIFNPHHDGRKERFDFKLEGEKLIADGAGVEYSSEQIGRCKKIIDAVSAGNLRVFRASDHSEVVLGGADAPTPQLTPGCAYLEVVSLAFAREVRLGAVARLGGADLDRALAEISAARNKRIHFSDDDVPVMEAIIQRMRDTLPLPSRTTTFS